MLFIFILFLNFIIRNTISWNQIGCQPVSMVIMQVHLQRSSSPRWIPCKRNQWDSSSCHPYRWRWELARAKEQEWKVWRRRCRERAMSTRCGCGSILTTIQRGMDHSSNLIWVTARTKRQMEHLRRSHSWMGTSTLCRSSMKGILHRWEQKQLKPLLLTQMLSLGLSWPLLQITSIVRTAWTSTMPTSPKRKRTTLSSTLPCKREATSRMPEVKSPNPIWQFHSRSQNSRATTLRTERLTMPTSEPQDARARSVGILKLPLQVRFYGSSK